MNEVPRFCVVDTNVAVVANLKAQVSDECALNCVSALNKIIQEGRVAIDDGGRILGEYRRNLSGSGQPGVGDGFLKWIYSVQAYPARCVQVAITPKKEDGENYEEFPSHPQLADFDPADRKFVAVSAAHPERPPILEAVDSKWWGWKDTLEEVQVHVHFLCPDDIQRLFKKRSKKKRIRRS